MKRGLLQEDLRDGLNRETTDDFKAVRNRVAQAQLQRTETTKSLMFVVVTVDFDFLHMNQRQIVREAQMMRAGSDLAYEYQSSSRRHEVSCNHFHSA